MAKIFYEQDCNLSLLEGKTIAIIGYGSQGHAPAKNLNSRAVSCGIGSPPSFKRRKSCM